MSWINFPICARRPVGLHGEPTWLDATARRSVARSQAGGQWAVRVQSYVHAERQAGRQQEPRLLADRRRRQSAALPRRDRVPGDRRLQVTAQKALESGDVDIIVDLERQGHRRVPRASRTTSRWSSRRSTPRPTTFCCTSPRRAPPLADRRVRCALSLAIDRQELIDAIERRHHATGQRSVLARPAGLPGGQRSGPEQDIDAAQER